MGELALVPGVASPGAPEQGVSRGLRINKWKNTNSGRLSLEERAQLWIDAGGRKDEAPLAAVISEHESHGEVDVVNSIGATGIWQIHPGGPQYKNAWNNARAAVRKRRASRNKWGPNPWAVCTDAACSNLLGEAKALERNMRSLDVGGIDIPTPGDAVDSIGDGIEAVLKPIGDFFKIITSADTWIRVGKVILGALLLLLVANELTGAGSRLARRIKAA